MVVGTAGFPLIVIVDATLAVAAPLSEKASTPVGALLVELTVMVVPSRVVTVADPGAVAKMPLEKLPPVKSIVPPLKFTVAVPLPDPLAFKPNEEPPPTIVKFPVALMMALLSADEAKPAPALPLA